MSNGISHWRADPLRHNVRVVLFILTSHSSIEFFGKGHQVSLQKALQNIVSILPFHPSLIVLLTIHTAILTKRSSPVMIQLNQWPGALSRLPKLIKRTQQSMRFTWSNLAADLPTRPSEKISRNMGTRMAVRRSQWALHFLHGSWRRTITFGFLELMGSCLALVFRLSWYVIIPRAKN
jgi:hypothetical protein